MKRLGIFLVILTGFVASVSQPRAQGPDYGFNCIGSPTTGMLGQCSDGSTGLRGNTMTGLKYVSVAGFWGQADGGGGSFYDLGVAATYCSSPFFTSMQWSISASSPFTINFLLGSSIANVTVGETLSGGGIQPGAEIASISSGAPLSP